MILLLARRRVGLALQWEGNERSSPGERRRASGPEGVLGSAGKLRLTDEEGSRGWNSSRTVPLVACDAPGGRIVLE